MQLHIERMSEHNPLVGSVERGDLVPLFLEADSLEDAQAKVSLRLQQVLGFLSPHHTMDSALVGEEPPQEGTPRGEMKVWERQPCSCGHNLFTVTTPYVEGAGWPSILQVKCDSCFRERVLPTPRLAEGLFCSQCGCLVADRLSRKEFFDRWFVCILECFACHSLRTSVFYEAP